MRRIIALAVILGLLMAPVAMMEAEEVLVESEVDEELVVSEAEDEADEVAEIGELTLFEAMEPDLAGEDAVEEEGAEAASVAEGLEANSDVVDGGWCGENDVSWTLYSNGELVIEGDGAMYDYATGSPWARYSIDDAGGKSDRIDTVTIGDGITYIGRGAFRNSFIRSVSIGSGVTRLGNYAFAGCTELTSVELPADIETLPEGAFMGCTRLTRVKLPKDLAAIGTSAFEGTNLKYVDLPAGLAEIGDNAFCDSGLQSIHIPAGVTTISNTAFRQCGDIARITVDSGNSRFSAEDDALYSGTSLVLCAPQHVGTLTLRKGVKTILTGAFYQSRVERLILPEGLETIQDGAFEGASSLRRVDLPKSLKAAGLKAFRLAQKDSGGKSYGFTVYAEYGTYAHSYCRSQYAKLNNYGYIPSYICTRAIGKKGDNGSLKLNPGEKLLLQPEYFDDMDLKVLSYSTSDKKVATVSSSGLVTAKKKGTAVITILGEDGVKATLKVKVGDIFTPTRIKLNKSGTVKLRTGRKLTLTATIKPASAVTTVKWSNSKKQFATLEATGNTATITGVKPGTTTITVSTSNGRKAKLNVKVYTPETKTLDLNPADMTLFLGQGYQLRPVIDEGSTTTFTYTIKDKNVAKVSSKGKITALKVGTTKIVVKTKKGLKKTGTITVVPETSTTHYKNGTSGISVYALYEEPCYHMKEDCIELTYVPSKVPLEMALNYDKDPCPVCAATAALQVYYHKDGTYYHYDRTCSGVIEETRTLGEARAAGFSPCPKCVLFANHSQAVPQE